MQRVRRTRWCVSGALIALCTSAAAAVSDDRADIEKLLAQMSAAALAGDTDAYMKNVRPEPPEFLVEQTHWAADLPKHPPLEFRLELVGDPIFSTPAAAQQRAACQVRMTYRAPIGHAATAKGKKAEWPGVFVKDDADGDGPEPARWRYAGEDWRELQGTYDADGTPGEFVVMYLAGAEDVARDVVAAFPEAKAHVDEGFEAHIHARIPIKLYNDMEHLKAWVYLSMPDEILGGWNEPGESVKFMANYTRGKEHWRAAFAHEYAHYVTWTLGPKIKSAPWWMSEGVAELAAEQFTGDRDRLNTMMTRLARGDAGGRLCSWDEISDYDTAAQPVKRMAYLQGHHLMGYVSERWGRSKRNAWIRAVANGESLDKSTHDVYGISFAALDQAWRASLTGDAVVRQASGR